MSEIEGQVRAALAHLEQTPFHVSGDEGLRGTSCVEITWVDGPGTERVERALTETEGFGRRGKRAQLVAGGVPVYLERRYSDTAAAKALVRTWHEETWDGALYFDDDWSAANLLLEPDEEEWEFAPVEELAARLLLDRTGPYAPARPEHLFGVLAPKLFLEDPRELWDLASLACEEPRAQD